MKKRLTTALLASAMAASMVIPAMAGPNDLGGAVPSSSGTEVWAGIVIEDMDAKIKVEVPTLFAFVVRGTTDLSETGTVTSAAGDIYLPNVKVKVINESDNSGNGGVYELQTEGNLVEDGKLPFTNYSTYTDDDGTTRKGLEVTINGNIKNEGTLESRNNWTHTTSTNTGLNDFKNYNVSIDSNPFDTAANGGLQMANGIALTGPDTDLGGSQANVDVNSKYATVGETYYAQFDVSVGGKKNEYKQVEESAKVGTIVWTISAEINGDDLGGVITAPDAPYLPY